MVRGRRGAPLRGVCGASYFKISHSKFLKCLKPTTRTIFEDLFIAYRELLAVLLAFQVFAKIAPNHFIRVNSDNTNVIAWLNKDRCLKKMGFILLSAIEAFKFKFGLKVRAFHIKSVHNTSADALSRGHTPQWLVQRGAESSNDIEEIIQLLENPATFWKSKRRNTLVKAFKRPFTNSGNEGA